MASEYDRDENGDVLPPGVSDNEGDLGIRADGGGVAGYLPPEGPQNVHRVPYRWIEGQGRHKIGNAVVDSPEPLILTGNQRAQRVCEDSDLEQVSDEVADAALEAILDEDVDDADQVAEIVADYRAGNEDLAAPESDRPDIPGDLGDVPYRGDDEADLQDLAQAHGVKANQSADELREALAAVRDEEGE